MTSPPRVFIGSSSEGLHIATALQTALGNEVECDMWSSGFDLGTHYYESLIERTHQNDFAVFVFSADDLVASRDESSAAPRDNVVFELGLFSGVMGRRRVFVVEPKVTTVKIPSDLVGIETASYAPPEAAPDDRRWESALAPAARTIRQAIKRELALVERAVDLEKVVPSSSIRDLLASAAIEDARGGRLRGATGTMPGDVVVHRLHGVGQVVGFDPEVKGLRVVRVQFDSGLAAIPAAELFDPRESAG